MKLVHSFGNIPDWNDRGLIPAIEGTDPTSRRRSPYSVSMYDLVAHFGNTEARRTLLAGLLEYRAELHQAGLVSGFQWISGSFVEDTERIGGRGPRDIDVVTFFHIPDRHNARTLVEMFPDLFDRRTAKDRYAVDSYFVMLNPNDMTGVVERSVYWSSLWSHTRAGRWKGYLQVDLSGGYDDVARGELARIAEGGRV